MTSKALRWGIIGAGTIGGEWVEALAILPENEHDITAIAEIIPDRAQAFLKKHRLCDKGVSIYSDYTDLLADTNVDIVYIALLNHLHCPATLAALDAGKHVLCEKPLGLNDAEVKQMVTRAREKRLFLQEGLWCRFIPIYQRIREELAQKSIGEVRMVQANFGVPLMWNERVNTLALGGGVLLDVGGYLVQFALLAFGPEAKIEQITAIGSKAATGVDRTVNVVIRFEGDRWAQLMCAGETLLDCHAVIGGTGGRISIPRKIHCNDTIVRSRLVNRRVEMEEFQFPRPKCDMTRFSLGESMCELSHQATAIRGHILAGRLESSEMPLDESIRIAEILTEIRRQIGVQYPQEQSSLINDDD